MADLSHWDIMERFGPIHASQLISGLDPTSGKLELSYPAYLRMKDAYDIALDALRANSVADAPDGLYSLMMGVDFDGELFTRKEISRWINAVGVKSIYSFDINDIEANKKIADRWPWGNHHTELLGHLEAAALRWWVNYDPIDATTAPINKDVSSWLIKERKVSESMANAIASILRPDGLPTGPRK